MRRAYILCLNCVGTKLSKSFDDRFCDMKYYIFDSNIQLLLFELKQRIFHRRLQPKIAYYLSDICLNFSN